MNKPNLYRYFVPILCCGILACAKPQNDWSETASIWIDEGAFQRADSLLNTVVKERTSNDELRRADSLQEIMRRWRIEFPYDSVQITEQIHARFGDTITSGQIARWEDSGQLEMRRIDGEKRYFRRAVGNLFHLVPELSSRAVQSGDDPRIAHLHSIVDSTTRFGAATHPVRTTVHYTLTVHPNAVPEGDTLRCWLPYPQEIAPRQTDIELLGSFPATHTLAPVGTPQRSIYLEQVARKDSATRFEVTFRIINRARYFSQDSLIKEVQPYDTTSEVYRTYTAERPSQILFSDRLTAKARELAGNETNPVRIVSRIYDWIDEIPWAGSIEYSVLPHIPEYVLSSGHGDCGQVGLLLITMLRSVGIPARWESGWTLFPLASNLHDWGSVYYEGVGWVPIDVSAGRQASDDPAVRNFYKSGLDSYRLVVNSDYSYPFVPRKIHMRSEPIDFQRGEVETSERNLYFDEWDYFMEISYE